MKSVVSFSDNGINVKTSIFAPFLLASAGAVMLACGVYFISIVRHIDHLLIGLGIVFLFSGLFLLFNSSYYKILINEEPGYLSLVESTGWDISPLKIPFKYFSEIIIQYLINRDKPEYEIMLRNRYNSLMLVSRFYDEEKALNFAKRFEKAMSLKVTLNTEIPSHLIEKRHAYNPYSIVIPDNSSIKTMERRDFAEISWKVRYNPIQIAFLFCIYYGFFHIIHFSLLPAIDASFMVVTVIDTLLGLLLSFLIIFIVALFSGSYHFIAKKDAVIYFYRLFGRNYSEREMKKSDIALVRSSIDLNTEEILLVSKKGVESLNNLIKQYSVNNSVDKKMVDISDIKAFDSEMMRLKTSTLKLSEKLYIEQFIMKNL